MNIELLAWVLTIIATATLTISGVIQAARQQFDFFGAFVLAFVSSVGGGTVRDLLLDAPVFWVNDYRYIVMIAIVAALSISTISIIPKGKGIRMKALAYVDAMGLALFTILGVQKAVEYGVHSSVAIIMGVVTGVVGGIIRDLLCNEQPDVLKKDIYATLSFAGATAYVLLLGKLSNEALMLLIMVSIFVARSIVIKYELSFPHLEYDK